MKKGLLTLIFIFPILSISLSQTYYSKSSGSLNTLSTWGTNLDGSGTSPLSFTVANRTYVVVNNTAPTISANWTVSGANSKIVVGDGSQSINFTIPSTLTVAGPIDVQNSATLTIQSATAPALNTLASGSTVVYSRAGAQTVNNAAYYNLTMAGTGAKTLANTANSSIAGILNVFSGTTFGLNTNSSYTLTLGGTVTGTGSITGNTNSCLTISGTGTLGTLSFTAGSQTLRNFVLNRTSAGLITLGSSLSVGNIFTHSNGVLALNGNAFTLAGPTTFPVSATNGSITGSSTSSISVFSSSISNNLYFTPGAQQLNSLTLNSTNQTLSLGSNLTVTSSFTQTRGTIKLNGNTLTLGGSVTFPGNANNGTTTGSSTAGLILNATSISNALNMTTGGQTLGSFTMNSNGQTLTLGTNLTVSGQFIHTSGVIDINGQTLSIGGNINFPASSANGSISGSGTSNLSILGTSIINNLYFTAGSNTLNDFTLNGAGQTVTLGGGLTVSGAFTQTNGTLALNGNLLTLSGSIVFPASSTNGSITGSSTSSLSISASSISNILYLTGGNQTLSNFTLNSSGETLSLGGDLTVNSSFIQSAGIFNINGQTLTLNGTITFPTNAANTVSGSSSSNLIINASTITRRIYFTTGAQTLNNLTINCTATQTFRIGTSLTVNGTYTQSKGIFRISNNCTLHLNGAVVLPANSALGTTRGSNTAGMNISATAITNKLYFTTGAQALGTFTLNSPAQTLTLGTPLTISTTFNHSRGILDLNSQTLTINGAITFPTAAANGSLSGSATTTLSIGGTGTITNSLYMTQSGTANYLNSFTFNRTGRTLTLGNTLTITNVLTPTAGTFASSGNLILLATSSTQVGRIDVIGGSVTGNVTAQMYAKGGKTGWTLLGSPGLTGRTFSDWDDNTTITCATCPDGYFYSFTSVYWYDETVGGLYSNTNRYKPITHITDAMVTGRGYWVYLGTSTVNTNDIILDATGPVNQGNFTLNLTRTNTGGGTNAADHGFNLISNPYPSPILWSALRNGNASVSNAIYIYNPDLSGYASYVNGVSSPAVSSGGISNSIPGGQAFYVKVNTAAVTLTGQESNKTASAQELRRTMGQQIQTSQNPMVMRLNITGHGMKNETAIYFDNNATTAFDNEYDAIYFGTDKGHLGIRTQLGSDEYSINGLPALNQNFSIPIKATADTTGTYSISATDLQNIPGGGCIILHDNYTGLDKDLRTGAYSCTINDTEKTIPRFVLNITINNSLQVTLNNLQPTCMSTSNGRLTATASGTGPWNYYWKDANNNIIQTHLNKAGADTLFNVTGGDYNVDVNTVGTCDNGTQHIALQSTHAPTAGYTTTTNTVVFMADSVGVTFGNTSINANSYWWDFGDGTGAGCVDTTFYYASPGDYTATLIAIDTICGDSSVYTDIIHVIDGNNTTEIANNTPIEKKLLISRDEMGYYAQFNFTIETNAIITVQDILGAKVIGDINIKNLTKERIYIPLGENYNRILIISVATGAGDKVYSKIVH